MGFEERGKALEEAFFAKKNKELLERVKQDLDAASQRVLPSAGAEAGGRKLADLELTTAASVEFTDDVEEAGRRHASGYAFTIGAMGSAKTNFYNESFARQGFGEQVLEVERLWRSGEREAAAAAVPVEIGIGCNLLGTDDDVRTRLRLHRDAGMNSLRVNPQGDTHHQRLDCLARLLDLVREVNDETGDTT